MEEKWGKKDLIALFIVPLEFILGNLISNISFIKNNQELGLICSVGIFFIGFLIMITLYKDLLSKQWKTYKKKLWLKLILNILLVIGAFFILQITRGFLSKPLSINEVDQTSYMGISLMLIGSIQPFIAPFAEELTFRYLLFQKIKPKILKFTMFFVSSILFGLIHINNFNGDWIQTIPYMFVGAYFALICFGFKNIWGSIITHWIFNSLNSIVPALGILLMKIFGLI